MCLRDGVWKGRNERSYEEVGDRFCRNDWAAHLFVVESYRSFVGIN